MNLLLIITVALIASVSRSNGQSIAPRAFGDIIFYMDQNCSQRWSPSLDSTAYSYVSWFSLLESDISTVDNGGNMTLVPCLQPTYAGLQSVIASAQFQCSSDKPYYDPNLNQTLFGQAIHVVEYFNSSSCNAPSANQTWQFYGATGSCLYGTYVANGHAINLTAHIQCHYTGVNSAGRTRLSLTIIASVICSILTLIFMA